MFVKREMSVIALNSKACWYPIPFEDWEAREELTLLLKA